MNNRVFDWVVSLTLLGLIVGLGVINTFQLENIEFQINTISQSLELEAPPPLPGAGVFTTSYQTISNADLATAYTVVGIPSGAREMWIQVEGQNVRWRNDDTAPTTTVGMRIAAGDIFQYDLSEGDIQLIREASGATVHIWFERSP